MIYDTVIVYLRNSSSPFAKIDSSKKNYTDRTGQEFTFSNAQNNIPYYVEVKHRNALETWSADPVSFISDNVSLLFQLMLFTLMGTMKYRLMILRTMFFAFYSGDVNQDGTIDASGISKRHRQ